MSQANWFYANGQERRGPVAESDLIALITSGSIDQNTLVWAPELGDWTPLGQTRLAAHAMPPAGAKPAMPAAPAQVKPPAVPVAPSVPVSPRRARQAPPSRGRSHEADFPRFDVGVTILLAFVTCGIYGFVAFYQCGRAYERASGTTTGFGPWFWAYIASVVFIGGTWSAAGVDGDWAYVSGGTILLGLAGSILGAFTLHAAMKARAPLTGGLDVKAPTLHLVLWIVASLLSDLTNLAQAADNEVSLAVGGPVIILIIVQAVFFFRDHELIADAIAHGPGRTATPFR